MQGVQKIPGAHISRWSAVWAWVCVALTPVGPVVAAYGGEVVPDAVGDIVGGVILFLLILAAPIAGLVLGLRAIRAGQRSGTAAAVVSGTLLALFLLAVGFELIEAASASL